MVGWGLEDLGFHVKEDLQRAIQMAVAPSAKYQTHLTVRSNKYQVTSDKRTACEFPSIR